ncbi:MAG: class IV adenylate cyclase [Bacteroidota bacterium]
MHINFEFKARKNNIVQLEKLLLQEQPRFIGEDLQTDTYYNVPYGRLKMREGNIENALIHYHRNDVATAKQSDVTLYRHNPDSSLKQILVTALGIKVVVEKKRRIYFIDNVKFHFDEVAGLGKFVEVEAIDTDGSIGIEKLKQQCNHYASLFCITHEEFVSRSYSDLLLAKKSSTS